MTSGPICILGAGAMGSALATPLRAAGQPVRLWGTWLDDHLLDACAAGEPHPRTGVALPAGVELHRSTELEAALRGADLLVIAVASEGVEEVTRRAARGLTGARAVLLTSKGFAPDASGQVRLLPDAIRDVLREAGVACPPIVAVGGPCKANEVAAGRPTACVFACQDPAVAHDAAQRFSTASYRPLVLQDEVGVEVSAALKNVYAIALGFADGLAERTQEPWHNLKAACFAQATREMAALAEALGGRAATAEGLAGTGDLEVTGLSGRNRVYGTRLGRGEGAQEALEAMQRAEQTVEGVAASEWAAVLVGQRRLDRPLPLLSAVRALLEGADDPVEALTRAVLPTAQGTLSDKDGEAPWAHVAM